MSERRVGQAERRLERKMAKVAASTHGGYEGPSIIDRITSELDNAMREWRELKLSIPSMDYVEHGDPEGDLRAKRGIVRGLALALAMYRSPHNPDPKVWEREALDRVKDGA